MSVRIVDLDKLPPKANDDKVLRNVGIDPTPYNQTNINDRPTFEKLTLVGANDSGGLTGYNGGAENGSADTSINGNGWNNAETGSPLSLYDGDNANTDPYGITPYSPKPSLLTEDGEQNGNGVSGSGAVGYNFVAIAGLGLEGDISFNADGSITIAGGILAGPAAEIKGTGYLEGSIGQGSKDGIYGAGCGSVGGGAVGGTSCAGFSSNGGKYVSGSVDIGPDLGGGVYGKIGYAKTFNKPNKQKGNQ